MVCYAVPIVAAIAHYFMRKKIPSMKDKPEHRLLTLMFAGGAIFGVVDHAWNRELFLIGPNLFSDIALGVTITLVIMLAWKLIVMHEKASARNPAIN